MTTAGDQINGALRLLGVLAEGETPSAETSQDALTALNQMIDSWNTERLAVFSTQDQVFLWPPGELNRTLGPTGDFVGNRPVLLDDAQAPAARAAPAAGVGIQIRLHDGVAQARWIPAYRTAAIQLRVCFVRKARVSDLRGHQSILMLL